MSRFWRAIRESLAGTHRDYTAGSIRHAILMLAIPMVLELCLESVFAVVDVFFVARLGSDAVATVALTESLLALVYAVAMGLSAGATAIVARRIGERDSDGAARASVQAVLLGVFVAVPVGVLGATYAPTLLRLMEAGPDVIAHTTYTRIMLGGDAAVMLLFLINAVFRGAGDAAIAMRVLWIANLFNIFLDPCFIFGLGPFPRLGVVGAAVATTTGRSIGVLLQLYCLTRRDGRVVVRREHLRFEPRVMLTMVRLSGSAVVQGLIPNLGWIGLVRVLATFGSAAVAGFGIAFRIMIFVLLPAFGLANAAATLVGQNLGAGRPDRAEAAVWKACFYNMVFLSCVGSIFVAAPVPLIRAFQSDPDVSSNAVLALRIMSAGFPFYAYAMVLSNSFNGAGDTLTPTLVNVVCFWFWELPIAYVLAHLAKLGPAGVFWSIAIAYSTMAVVCAGLFRRGRWKLARV